MELKNTASDYKSTLTNKIWKTRKSRINASERLLAKAKYFELLNVVYSIFVIALSVISLLPNKSNYAIFSTIGSTALAILVIYANTSGLRDRSYALKNNYISLHELLNKMESVDSSDKEAIDGIAEEYTKLLNDCENHTSFDMYRSKHEAHDEKWQLTWDEKAKYFVRVILEGLAKAIFILLPIGILIYLIIAGWLL